MTDETTTEMLAAMAAVNDNAARLISEIGADQWHDTTPCTEWNVRDLVNHMVGTTRFFAASAGRVAPPGPADGDQLGDDPVATFRAVAETTMAAWNAPGAVEGSVEVPAEMPAVAALGINLLDTGTHCWDLAMAIGADHGLTVEQAELIDACSRQTVSDEVRSYAGFGEDLDDGSADGFTATLAFLGRRA
ncbi:MAG: TIGR03086 family metal-binding protein [Actinomycetota bacterium]